jgi:Fe-S oxidoreductase
MASRSEGPREGSLEAPTRHPLDWTGEAFYNEAALFTELERVFDICHGCRRCFSLCNAFPTLFDAIDESDTMELDGVAREVYWEVVDHCYLCDMCYMTKCPYVPPHEWNVDFPHLMLRAKAVKFKQGRTRPRDRLLSSTDRVGRLAGIPVVAGIVNAGNRSQAGRKLLEKVLGVHPDAILPAYAAKPLRKREAARVGATAANGVAAGPTTGKVAVFATCYCNYNEPEIGADLIAVLRHNDIPVTLAPREQCCGMPKLELGGRRLGYCCAGSLLCADVQAGITTDVSRRPRCRKGPGRDV